MLVLLLILALGQSVGQITGVLRNPSGAPVPGVRVAAIAASSTASDPGTTLVSLSETDKDGRFVLENVPPGRYYIMAGRIDQPTFYPGTLDATKGTVLTIKADDRLSDIDVVIEPASYLPAGGQGAGPGKLIAVPIVVQVEGGGTLPSSAGQAPTVQLVPAAGGNKLEVTLSSPVIRIPASRETEEYRVRIENLPPGYRVKAVTFGTTDLMTDTLKASLQELSASPRIVTYTGEGELQRKIDQIVQRQKALTITLTSNGVR